jgi:hypothetical protein
MRRLIVAAALVMSITGFAATADGGVKLQYQRAYSAVKHKHGKRAPGRNILRDGIRGQHGIRAATQKELRRSTVQLKQILHPVRVVRYLAPAAPAQPPAQVQTMRAPAGGTLDAIAQCESGGNPHAVGGGGAYRGKYQFDYGTWQSVGGSGDPAAAPEAEQDRRAAMLYAQSGSNPWPVCGR